MDQQRIQRTASPALTEEVASTDATLSALALSGVTLSPAFDADTETPRVSRTAWPTT